MDADTSTRADPYHYGVIGRAIETIADRREEQLSLQEVAESVGMSPAHFQRVFSAWAGVSPKRYQQYLTLDHARRLLASRHSVLETALGTGLSGSGRLHDLFLRWEAMSPGDYAAGGAGLTVRWGWVETPFGPALAMATDRGLCGLAFAVDTGRAAAMADLRARWPKASFVEDHAAVAPLVAGAFGNGGETRLHLIGAPFQIKVWEALLHVADGHVTTYGEIAAAIGNPKAVRAVGTAVGRNPIAWLIPCHRVIRATGVLGDYRWGSERKKALLGWEAARHQDCAR